MDLEGILSTNQCVSVVKGIVVVPRHHRFEHQQLQQGDWTLHIAISGILKFNIDDAMTGSFGAVGIGGVLRNHEGKIFCSLSKNVGIVNTPTAKLLVTKEVVKLFKSSI
ncbi:hypothetical protein GQ457_03G021060 [Hibiscus cannabinus]